jgi:UDPglucose--hexose-1-phosphate uridylyltransferase
MKMSTSTASLYKLQLRKPDGRRLILYSHRDIVNVLEATQPRDLPVNPNPHFRWHPLRGEWVAYAAYRQTRTFLPPPEYNPLAPTQDPAHPTELPAGDYEVAVFENGFPSLTLAAHDPPDIPSLSTEPARGVCEVVVYTQDPRGSLGALPLERINLILQVWADRYREVGHREDIQYVMPFENRGVEVGVTLHHPHGQIYAYPFIPPAPARELEEQLQYYKNTGRSLLGDLIRTELDDGRRVIYAGTHTIAFVPAFARYTYEVWIAPKQALGSVADLNDEQREDFARALKTVLLKYDGLWKKPFPYIMIFHQAPTRGNHPEAHFHIEFYPPYRTPDKLKYLAGTEIGAGMFTSDSLPEQKAAELQAVRVDV